jgi:hypothetical protein
MELCMYITTIVSKIAFTTKDINGKTTSFIELHSHLSRSGIYN